MTAQGTPYGWVLWTLLLAGFLVVVGLFGCGSSEQMEPDPVVSSDEVLLREKLALCADEWNDDGAKWNSPSTMDPAGLISTTPEGQCLLVVSSPEPSIPAWAVERDENGAWDQFISSDKTDENARIALLEEYEYERRRAPNVIVTTSQAGGTELYAEFEPTAPIPATAQLEPELLANPEPEACDGVVTFSGGTIGDFYLTVENAAGISCREAAKIAKDFPFFIREWNCSGERRVDCAKGDVWFTLLRRDGSPSDSGRRIDSAPIAEPPASEDGYKQPLPMEGFSPSAEGDSGCGTFSTYPRGKAAVSDIHVSGTSCSEALQEIGDWLDQDPESDGPPSWECKSEFFPNRLPIPLTEFVCQRGKSKLRFNIG